MKNTDKSTFKRTQIDHLLNRIILEVRHFFLILIQNKYLFFLLIMCAIMIICCGFWESYFDYDFRMYL
jgi:hypothetical protein